MIPEKQKPNILVLAGINGAGKTTSSRQLLAETLGLMTFVNADVIAQGLSGFDVEAASFEAGRIMLERLHQLAEQQVDFAFETTLASRSYGSWLGQQRKAGFDVHLFYFWLKSADLAVSRVAARVSAGGHHVPEVTIRRRYSRSIRNLFELYMPVVTTWRVYDNTDYSPVLVAQGGENQQSVVHVSESWSRILEVSKNG